MSPKYHVEFKTYYKEAGLEISDRCDTFPTREAAQTAMDAHLEDAYWLIGMFDGNGVIRDVVYWITEE